jgi:hypothetical protein
MASSVLANERTPTAERIREVISQLRSTPIANDVDHESSEHLAKELEVRFGIIIDIGAVLQEHDYEPWLDSARGEINPYYWDRYKQLLIDKKLPGPVITTLDSVTDRILGLLENPQKDGQWDRRGMVVGHVQSGKTANYTGLICKAADAGYKLIVVIAGVHNNLRNQTQLRIDEGFVGRDSARLLSRMNDLFVGVGRFDKTRRPVTFTNSLKDFNKAMATGIGIAIQDLNEPAVLVIKKNSSTLKNLTEWLKEHSLRGGTSSIDAPMVLIDDEADNASINTRYGKGEVSKINAQIRDLLQIFDRSCYIGYTATPFANIFIDPDTDDEMLGSDLFPRDFIVSLDPPSNYVGPTRMFIDEPDQFIRYIDDNEDLLPLKHRKELEVPTLPPSLIDAMRTFVVGKAIRLARGHAGEHASMLVNASRFLDVQRQLRNEILNELRRIQASVRINGSLPSKQALNDYQILALHDTWESEFGEAVCGWDLIQPRLNDAASPISVVEVNGNSSGTLNYAEHARDGLNVIAIGGFSLSRGLTLEGLTVSYFLRNSMMYDTLMQMGRWFGYRLNYDDLCRVWMPEDADGWYAHIAESIEMLREELRRMESAGATPKDFGLKVRSHPDTLIVTARNKMGSGERFVVNVGLANHFVETATLRRDQMSLDANREVARGLASRLSQAGYPISEAVKVPGGRLLRGAPAGPILDFILGFKNHAGSLLTDGSLVRKYIEDRTDDELAVWDIFFPSLQQDSSPDALTDNSLGIPINCQKRSAGNRSDSDTIRVTNKQRVSSRGVEKNGLTPDEIEDAETRFRKNRELMGTVPADPKNLNYPDYIYRENRTYPLLIVHLLKILPEQGGKPHSDPVIAWSISFPGSAREEKKVEYVVTTTWLRENESFDLDEDDMDGDDE